MALDIWFGQFNMVGGAVQEEGPYIGIFEGDAETPDRVAVYVLVEPCGRATPELCASTIEVIARGFGAPGQPLTASLLRALNAAQAHVRGEHPGMSDSQFGVGVTVLAARRGEAYIVQAGPALACVRSGGVTRLIQPPGTGDPRPLGGGVQVTPSFSRLQLGSGDAAILLFSDGEQLLGAPRLHALAAQGPEQALPEMYMRSRGADRFAALYLAVTGERRASEASDPRERAGAAAAARSIRREEPAAARLTAVADGDTPAAEDEAAGHGQRDGHEAEQPRARAGAVRSFAARRPPLGSMATGPAPITRRHLGWFSAVLGIVLLALLVVPNLARQGKSERFTQLVRGADEVIAAAEREPDLARRRTLLAQAQATVDEARTLRNAPGELTALEQRLSSQLAEIDGVRELADLVPVADLAAPGLAAQAASQIAAGPSIYVLDATAGKVVALPRQGEPRPLTVFEEGRPAGQNRTGRARQIAWWPAEGSRAAALLVLDDQRRLYAVDARGDIRAVALGDASEWRADTALAVGTSHLYVLDAGANQVWRYALNAGGFPGAPEPLLGARASLKDAASLSLAGGPIISTSDGRLLRVSDGREQVMQPVGMDRPLLAPSAPLLNGSDGLLYLADRGNQRIVRLGPDGAFHGQLVHHRLAGLQAIAIDEAEGALYAIAGQTIMRATIPR